MINTGLAFSIPEKKVSAWVAETEPKHARNWLSSLPMADAGEAAREIYQALYTLNRQDLSPGNRYKLMELYREPVATVANSLRAHLQRATLPLTAGQRQLAEFIRHMQLEMANGYKCVIYDSRTAMWVWGKRKLVSVATDRAIFYLGKVLFHSYQVYMPAPAGAWREIHALYHFAEQNRWFGEAAGVRREGTRAHAIYQRYLQTLLLALCNPYQLPEHEVDRIYEFLLRWSDKAALSRQLRVAHPVGRFLVDLAADAPPAPFPHNLGVEEDEHLRVLNALDLARVVQGFIKRIQAGEPVSALDLGTQCLESAGMDMLQRMLRFWGQAQRRQRTRTKADGHCFLATGINAVHFFSSGQQVFTPPDAHGRLNSEPGVRLPVKPGAPAAGGGDEDTAFVDLEGDSGEDADRGAQPTLAAPILRAQEVYRVGRWRIRDESSGGLLLVGGSDNRPHLRVGDLLGIQDLNNLEHWRVGVVRWLKTSSPRQMELGVELLAPQAVPVAVLPSSSREGAAPAQFTQALLLPALPALRRPQTLVIPRGIQARGEPFLLAGPDGRRRLKTLEVLERTGSFEQVVFADVAPD